MDYTEKIETDLNKAREQRKKLLEEYQKSAKLLQELPQIVDRQEKLILILNTQIKTYEQILKWPEQ